MSRIKDRLWTLDQKRYEDALAEGTLTKGEKDFISNAVDKKWKPKKNKDGSFASKEAEVAAKYKEFTNYL